MGSLVQLIDEYKDAHGNPSDSSIARAIGAAPQTISSWRTRGIKGLPDRQLLEALAQFMHLDYEDVVLRAVLLDIGWLPSDEDAEDETPASERGRGA